MKWLIKFALAITGIMIFQFLSCKKDTTSSSDCLVSTATQFERRLEFTYDNNGRIIKVKNFPDTVYNEPDIINLSYNSSGSLASVKEDFTNNSGLIDSIAFEYLGKTAIMERQFYRTGTGMAENYQRTYKFDSNNYLTSDTFYTYSYAPPYLTLSEYNSYEYDNIGNIIKMSNYRQSQNGSVLNYTMAYEYSDTLIPNTSYSIARFTFLSPIISTNVSTYNYILPHRINLVSKESLSGDAYGNSTLTHTFEFNSRKYPVKENNIRPQNPYFAVYKYNCN